MLTNPEYFSSNSSKKALIGVYENIGFSKTKYIFLKVIGNYFYLIYRYHALSAYFWCH